MPNDDPDRDDSVDEAELLERDAQAVFRCRRTADTILPEIGVLSVVMSILPLRCNGCVDAADDDRAEDAECDAVFVLRREKIHNKCRSIDIDGAVFHNKKKDNIFSGSI